LVNGTSIRCDLAESRPDRVPVAVTGVGAVTALGIGAEATFAALCDGRNGIREISAWKAAGFPVTYGGVVDGLGDLATDPLYQRYRSRKAVFAARALEEALAQSGGPAHLRHGRGGIFLGIEIGRPAIARMFALFQQAGTPQGLDATAFGERCFQYLTTGEVLAKQPFFLAGLIGRLAGATGAEARSISNGCSSANQAIGEAYRKIAAGHLDWAITGGADDMVDEYMAIGFHLLGALATGLPPETASRPFDLGRRGFVLGEGAGLLVLEALPRALARGAVPLALIAGYGAGATAQKITETTWEGIYQTMAAALAEGRCAPGDIDYINAHGTGTAMNDPAETRAIKELFGAGAAQVPISSTKSMVGHLIAAAGAVEAVVCVQSIRQGRLHPTRNLQRRDPACDLDFISEGARFRPVHRVLSNSLGFAGINSTLLFAAPPG
jgi:3-oxoacyl-[acyl-carrier-protein] synthase II